MKKEIEVLESIVENVQLEFVQKYEKINDEWLERKVRKEKRCQPFLANMCWMSFFDPRITGINEVMESN